jgi:hypothetical protein
LYLLHLILRLKYRLHDYLRLILIFFDFSGSSLEFQEHLLNKFRASNCDPHSFDEVNRDREDDEVE